MGRMVRAGAGWLGARRCLVAGAALSVALAGGLGLAAPQGAGAAEGQDPAAPSDGTWGDPAGDATPDASDVPGDTAEGGADGSMSDDAVGGADDGQAPGTSESADALPSLPSSDPLEPPELSEVVSASPETAGSDGEEPSGATEAGEEDVPASSWRFQDGQLVRLPDAYEAPDSDAVMPTLLSRAYYAPWSKVGDGYLSTNGSYIPGAVLRGVDVSVWDETIDWDAAKADDVDFAIIRCGYAASRGGLWTDAYWARNVSECERLGIPYGVYFYSRATTAQEAVQEAQYVLGLIAGHGLSYPVYLDLEDSSIADADLASVARAFCDTISAAGYQPGVYANLNWWNNLLTDPIFDSWPRWVAQYNSVCRYTGEYGMWQCTASGSVAGFHTGVDINFVIDKSFTPSQGGTTSDGWREENGRRYFYEGGRPLTGVHQIGEEWFYFDPAQGGAAYVGELNDDGAWYYYDAQGVLARSEFVTLTGGNYPGGSKVVYYDAEGRMVYGEANIGDGWYYFDPFDGHMVTGLTRIATVGGVSKTVLYGADGRMTYGEANVNGGWYYFDRFDGSMATGITTITTAAGVSKTVCYGSDGRMRYGEANVNGGWYYFDEFDGHMVRGWKWISADGGKTVYYGASGRMVYGSVLIDGVRYRFDTFNGALVG